MIVLDASAMITLLLGQRDASEVEKALAPPNVVVVPHLIDAEVGQALRNATLRGITSTIRGRAALDDFLQLPIERFAHPLLLARAFELRDNATIYDGLYLALAELLEAPLLTRDRALAQVPGVRAEVHLIG